MFHFCVSLKTKFYKKTTSKNEKKYKTVKNIKIRSVNTKSENKEKQASISQHN